MKTNLLKTCLTALFLLMASTMVHAQTYYGISLGGYSFHSERLTLDNTIVDYITSGSATYDPSTNTLTFNNLQVSINDYNTFMRVDWNSPLTTINLVGTNTISSSFSSSTFYGILYRNGGLTITGSGSLTFNLSGEWEQIISCDYSGDTYPLTIKDTTVRLNFGSTCKGYGLRNDGSNLLTIDNSNVLIDMSACTDASNCYPISGFSSVNEVDVMCINNGKRREWIPLDGVARAVTIASTTNGTVTPSAATAVPGAEVTLNIAPATGYVLDELTITDSESNVISVSYGPLTANVSFTMPNKAVTVTATFRETTTADRIVQLAPCTNTDAVYEVTIPEGFGTMKFYDTGGSSADYSSNEKYIVAFNAPAGYMLKMKTNNGNYNAEGSTYDYLMIGEGTGNTITDFRFSGYRHASGPIDITTTGQRLLAYFKSDSSTEAIGWDIDVDIVKISDINREYTVTPLVVGENHGAITLSQTTAAEGEQILYEVTADEGYYVKSVLQRDADDNALTVYQHHKLVAGEESDFYFFYMPAKNAMVKVEYAVLPTVTIHQQSHATVSIEPATPKPGEQVTITAVCDEGYRISTYELYFGTSPVDVGTMSSSDIATWRRTFFMPTKEVEITPVVNELNTVTCNPAEHGSIAPNKNKPLPFETVYLTASPDANYWLTSVSESDGYSSTNLGVDMWNNTASFTMPYDRDVTVDATFTHSDDLTLLTIPDGIVGNFTFNGTTLTVAPKLNTDGTYADNLSGTLVVSVPAGKVIKITGTAHLEASYDNLYIYDGTDSDTELLHESSGTTVDLDYMTTGNKVTIKFNSDSSNGYTNNNIILTVMGADDVPVEIGATGYATLYYSDRNLAVPSGLTAQTYYMYNKKLTLSGEHAIIPAGEAVVLQGTPNTTYVLTKTDATESKDARNLLYGADAETLVDAAGYKYFILSLNALQEAGSVGFYYQAGTEGNKVTNGAHKAYLRVPLADVPAGVMGYRFDDGSSTTGIDGVEIEKENMTDANVYTIDGRKVSANHMQKGIYIVNGKKVVVK